MYPDVDSRAVVAIVNIIHTMNTLIVFPEVTPNFPIRKTRSRHASSAAMFRMLPANLVGVDLSNDANGRTSLNFGADTLITSGCVTDSGFAIAVGVFIM